MDNFDKSVFTFTKCEEIFEIQCRNGKCFNKTVGYNDTEICNTNVSYVGYWNLTYPSEDYWQ